MLDGGSVPCSFLVGSIFRIFIHEPVMVYSGWSRQPLETSESFRI